MRRNKLYCPFCKYTPKLKKNGEPKKGSSDFFTFKLAVIDGYGDCYEILRHCYPKVCPKCGIWFSELAHD